MVAIFRSLMLENVETLCLDFAEDRPVKSSLVVGAAEYMLFPAQQLGTVVLGTLPVPIGQWP